MLQSKLDQIQRDFDAVKVVGTGKHAHVVPDMRRRLRALSAYLQLRYGPPPRPIVGPDGKLCVKRAWSGPFGRLPYLVLPSAKDAA